MLDDRPEIDYQVKVTSHSLSLDAPTLPSKVSVALTAHDQAWGRCLALFWLRLRILCLCLGSFPVMKWKLLETVYWRHQSHSPVAGLCSPEISAISGDIFRYRHSRRLLWSHTGARGRGLSGGGPGGGRRPVLLVLVGVKCREVCLHWLGLKLWFSSFLGGC